MSESYTVADYMTREVVTVQPDVPVSEVIVLLLKHKISGMPVVDQDGQVVGILSERDCLSLPRKAPL